MQPAEDASAMVDGSGKTASSARSPEAAAAVDAGRFESDRPAPSPRARRITLLTPFVSTSSPLAPWSAPPAPTGFTSRPPAARGLPPWWGAALIGAIALTLAIMAARAAAFLGWIRV